jgi:hypothetical protein
MEEGNEKGEGIDRKYPAKGRVRRKGERERERERSNNLTTC